MSSVSRGGVLQERLARFAIRHGVAADDWIDIGSKSYPLGSQLYPDRPYPIARCILQRTYARGNRNGIQQRLGSRYLDLPLLSEGRVEADLCRVDHPDSIDTALFAKVGPALFPPGCD